jgi:hypothetical protein
MVHAPALMPSARIARPFDGEHIPSFQAFSEVAHTEAGE